MQTSATIIIFVSILGCCLIVALVWLFYKYKAVKVANAAVATDLPPTRKLTIVRGRVVDATKGFTPSIRSGWHSLRSSVRRVPSSIISDEKYHPMPSRVAKSQLSPVAWSPEEDLERGEKQEFGILEGEGQYESNTAVSIPQSTYTLPRPPIMIQNNNRYSPSRHLLTRSIIDCLELAQSPEQPSSPTMTTGTLSVPQSPTSPGNRTRYPLQSKFQLQPETNTPASRFCASTS